MSDTDAQFGPRTVLRPYSGFEAQYNGLPVTHPIVLTPGGLPRDEFAGQPGYDPELVRGMKVPIGARVLLWLPILEADLYDGGGDVIGRYPYIYRVDWRMRSMADFVKGLSMPYHVPTQITGIAETGVNPGPRFVIPAATHGVMYNQIETVVLVTPGVATQHLWVESWEVELSSLGNAGAAGVGDIIMPNGARGAIQQGVAPTDAVFSSHVAPRWVVYETQAMGDEMIISVTRSATAGANWSFAPDVDPVDGFFETFYGNETAGQRLAQPDLGVYALVGSAP